RSRSATPNSSASLRKGTRVRASASSSMMRCCRSTRRNVRWLAREAAARRAVASARKSPENHDTGLSWFGPSVAGMTDTIADTFFATYRRPLLDRDAHAIADHYTVPALIEFPGQAIAVTDAQQTLDFFASAVGQSEGGRDTKAERAGIAEAGHSVWADAPWDDDGERAERF